jgi:hypothetical protein
MLGDRTTSEAISGVITSPVKETPKRIERTRIIGKTLTYLIT